MPAAPIFRALLGNTAPATCDELQATSLIEHGLGPIAFDAQQRGQLTVDAPTKSLLVAADLTARAIHAANLRSLEACLRQLNRLGIEPVLIKGMSLANRYPHPHWRIMSDIDLLVRRQELERTMQTLTRLGFEKGYPEPAAHWDNHHHAPPLHHPSSGLWLEVHHSLHSSRYFERSLFDPDEPDHRQPALGVAAKAWVMKPQLELQHCAAHWYLNLIEDLGVDGLPRALFDAYFLVGQHPIDASWLPQLPAYRFATLTLVAVLQALEAITPSSTFTSAGNGSANLQFAAQLAFRETTKLASSERAFHQQLRGRWFALALGDAPVGKLQQLGAAAQLLWTTVLRRLA